MTSDPLRTDATGPLNAASGVERDARIEQLLLAGLDHYFASQYEQAINIWTRALFFDRNHARARAYIERARRAQAERQRESEELLHNGTNAYRNGDVKEARRLLQAALDAGGVLSAEAEPRGLADFASGRDGVAPGGGRRRRGDARGLEARLAIA